MDVQITNDIPMPGSGGTYDNLPWDKLEVGQSFAIKGDKTSILSNARKAAEIKTGYRFTTAKRVENNESVIRVWRKE
jgi:hypothetical protein